MRRKKPIPACDWSNLTIAPAHLEFEVDEGYLFVPDQQFLRIETVGPGGLSPRWKVVTNNGRLTVNPESGKGSKTLKARADLRGIVAGRYKAAIKVIPSPDTVTVTPPIVNVTMIVKGVVETESSPLGADIILKGQEAPEPPQPPPTPPQPPPTPPDKDNQNRILELVNRLWELIKEIFRIE